MFRWLQVIEFLIYGLWNANRIKGDQYGIRDTITVRDYGDHGRS